MEVLFAGEGTTRCGVASGTQHASAYLDGPAVFHFDGCPICLFSHQVSSAVPAHTPASPPLSPSCCSYLPAACCRPPPQHPTTLP